MSDRNQKWGDVIKRMAVVASAINEPAPTSTASAGEPTTPVEDVQPICGEMTPYEDAPDLHTGCALNVGHKGPHSDGDCSWDATEPQPTGPVRFPVDKTDEFDMRDQGEAQCQTRD